jgi:hypothetical protein
LVSAWIEKWRPLASAALEAFAGVVTEAPVPLDPGTVISRITDDVTQEIDEALSATP